MVSSGPGHPCQSGADPRSQRNRHQERDGRGVPVPPRLRRPAGAEGTVTGPGEERGALEPCQDFCKWPPTAATVTSQSITTIKSNKVKKSTANPTAPNSSHK